ncbi:hypothetical protein BD289DRAFT_377027 [Coniella lustricola]|uniref:Uncharacterized protein n=1 Tax=Coniella lustricola TaxID=2025994 RepID=A0A2T2ZW21_9PEZI|nr:hypothetical protein BD289DRAFT_377027 [Coniella lustricola]
MDPSKSLPPLSDEPRRFPDLCLSLSRTLICSITDLLDLPDGSLVLSVGSGSGLLEAHLQAHWASKPGCTREIRGIEIRTAPSARPVNKWLPENLSSTVRGTWELSPELSSAGALLFVYPREPSLVDRYLLAAAKNGNGHALRTVIWLGPQADWETFEGCFRDVAGFAPLQIAQNCGTAEYEMLAVIQRLSA